MPPKLKAPASASTTRAQIETDAQRARAAALRHLAETCSGPSQKELVQQEKERGKWANATTQAIQERLARATAAATAPVGRDAHGNAAAPTHDNTLQAVAAQRARNMHHTQHRAGLAVTAAPLLDGWAEAKDPASGDTYYWNEVTKETSWKRPVVKRVEKASRQTKTTPDQDELDAVWEEVRDPHSGSLYYWNRQTNETTWTKPVKKNIPLDAAREAKSKLDAILQFCGSSSTPSFEKTQPLSVPIAKSERDSKSDTSSDIHSASSDSRDSRKRGPTQELDERDTVKHAKTSTM